MSKPNLTALHGLFLLGLMTPDQVDAVKSAIFSESGGSIHDAIDEAYKGRRPIPVLSVCTPVNFPDDASYRHMIYAFQTLVSSAVKSPMGASNYADVLMNAYGLDETYAKKLAAEIETTDAIGGGIIKRTFLKLARWIDASQEAILGKELVSTYDNDKFDSDKLWEWLIMGKKLEELSVRQDMIEFMASTTIAHLSKPSTQIGIGDITDAAIGGPYNSLEDEAVLRLATQIGDPWAETGGPLLAGIKSLKRKAKSPMIKKQLAKWATKKTVKKTARKRKALGAMEDLQNAELAQQEIQERMDEIDNSGESSSSLSDSFSELPDDSDNY